MTDQTEREALADATKHGRYKDADPEAFAAFRSGDYQQPMGDLEWGTHWDSFVQGMHYAMSERLPTPHVVRLTDMEDIGASLDACIVCGSPDIVTQHVVTIRGRDFAVTVASWCEKPECEEDRRLTVLSVGMLPPDSLAPAIDSRAEIQAEALEALAVRLRAIHTEGDFGCPNPRHRCSDLDYRGGYCPDAGTSCDACGEAYPCPTIAALDAEAQRIREGGGHD